MNQIGAFLKSSLHLDTGVHATTGASLSVEMQRRLHTTREEDCTDAALQDLVCRVCQATLHRPRPFMMGP